jgi:hypothetical protein
MTNPSPYSDSPVITTLSTPLIVVGTFVEILRERFSDENYSNPDLANWRWTNDDKSTRIFIESGFGVNSEVRGKRPGLWVDRLQNVYQKVSIGAYDQKSVEFNTRLEHMYMRGEMDLIVDCTSPNRGESMLLGGIVQDFLMMTMKPIMEVFAFLDVSPMILGRTEPFERERALWSSAVSFRVTYEVRWATMPSAPLLNKVVGRIEDPDYPASWRALLAD